MELDTKIWFFLTIQAKKSLAVFVINETVIQISSQPKFWLWFCILSLQFCAWNLHIRRKKYTGY